MKSLPFWKAESAGNDFVLVHAEAYMADTHFLSNLARFVSPRRTGIGSDGLLALAKSPSGLTLRMFNPDGTEDFCGNGLRIAAVHGHEQGWTGNEFEIQHHGHSVAASVQENSTARIVIGQASFHPYEVPMVETDELFLRTLMIGGEEIEASSLTTGSTHTVILVDELPEDERFERLSQQLEHSPIYPERTSVIWTRPISERDLRIRIWERGAGETLGCGTGSAAAAVVWFRKNSLSGRVTVINPGGPIEVEMESWNKPVSAQSVVREHYTGVIELPDDLSASLPQSGASLQASLR